MLLAPGGISGSTYLALSSDVRRAMLGVPGAPYGMLLPRSIDFDPFLLLVFIRCTCIRGVQHVDAVVLFVAASCVAAIITLEVVLPRSVASSDGGIHTVSCVRW